MPPPIKSLVNGFGRRAQLCVMPPSVKSAAIRLARPPLLRCDESERSQEEITPLSPRSNVPHEKSFPPMGRGRSSQSAESIKRERERKLKAQAKRERRLARRVRRPLDPARIGEP